MCTNFPLPLIGAELGSLLIAVGIPLTRYPPHRSGRALLSASGSYLGWLTAKRASG
jgi:hypothetical protein